MKAKSVDLTPEDVRALEIVLDAAITNSCQCADSDGKGFLGHDSKSCWVHQSRAILRRVDRIIVKAKASGHD